jgi:hypothetical protein
MKDVIIVKIKVYITLTVLAVMFRGGCFAAKDVQERQAIQCLTKQSTENKRWGNKTPEWQVVPSSSITLCCTPVCANKYK